MSNTIEWDGAVVLASHIVVTGPDFDSAVQWQTDNPKSRTLTVFKVWLGERSARGTVNRPLQRVIGAYLSNPTRIDGDSIVEDKKLDLLVRFSNAVSKRCLIACFHVSAKEVK